MVKYHIYSDKQGLAGPYEREELEKFPLVDETYVCIEGTKKWFPYKQLQNVEKVAHRLFEQKKYDPDKPQTSTALTKKSDPQMKLANAKERLKKRFEEFESVLNRHPDIPDETIMHLRAVLKEFKEKQKEEKLRLGVIGEFSTGKSTFINYLLGTDILAISDRPTTPVPVVIRYHPKERYYWVKKNKELQEIDRAKLF